MKILSKIMMGALLLASGSAFAQKNNGRGNGNQKTVIITDKKTTGNMNGVLNANEHASPTGKMHANEHSVLNRTGVYTNTHPKKHKKHVRKNRFIRKVN